MRASELAELAGLLGREAMRRKARGDERDLDDIADAILKEAGAPAISRVVTRVAAMYAAPLPRKLPA